MCVHRIGSSQYTPLSPIHPRRFTGGSKYSVANALAFARGAAIFVALVFDPDAARKLSIA